MNSMGWVVILMALLAIGCSAVAVHGQRANARLLKRDPRLAEWAVEREVYLGAGGGERGRQAVLTMRAANVRVPLDAVGDNPADLRSVIAKANYSEVSNDD